MADQTTLDPADMVVFDPAYMEMLERSTKSNEDTAKALAASAINVDASTKVFAAATASTKENAALLAASNKAIADAITAQAKSAADSVSAATAKVIQTDRRAELVGMLEVVLAEHMTSATGILQPATADKWVRDAATLQVAVDRHFGIAPPTPLPPTGAL